MADISKKVVRMCERFEEEVQKVVAEEVAEALAEGGSGEIEKLKEEKWTSKASRARPLSLGGVVRVACRGERRCEVGGGGGVGWKTQRGKRGSPKAS